MRSLLLFLSLSAVVHTKPAAAQLPVRTLGKPDVEYGEPFTQVNGIRELRDGRVIVADAREKSVQVIDLRAGRAQKVGREGSGPGEYALPARLLALPADTSVVYDPLNRRFLVIGPDGKAGPFVSYEPDESGPTRITIGARYTDARGRLYSLGSAFSVAPNGETSSADSAPILRLDRATRKTDTVAFVRVPPTVIRTSQGGANVSVRAGGGNPFVAADEWAVMPDGRVAIVRVKDYHVDWYAPNGQRTSGTAIAYDRIKVTDDDKKAFRERRASGGGTTMVITQQVGPNGTSRNPGAALPSSVQLPEPTDWPDVKPPFLGGAATATPNGQLWVLRSRPAKDRIPTYDVFDASGRVTGRVALPPDTRLVGFGNGTVYLVRSDDDDLQYLQRYRLP